MEPELLALIISSLTLMVFLISVLLIYRQLKQVERSIRGSTYQSVIDEASLINRIFVDNPDLADLWGSVKYVGVKGEPKEVRQAWIITMMMDFYENMYFQHEQGNIPEEIWERWKRHIIKVFSNTKVQEQWGKAKDVYYKSFREFIDCALNGEAWNSV
jgi:hypothetical protein